VSFSSPKLPVPAAIAAELALLEAATPALWFWEPDAAAVVLGLAGREKDEVRLEAARADGVPVLTRRSGGGAVVLAPGVLCFGMVLPREGLAAPGPRELAREVLVPAAEALASLGLTASFAGLGDIAVDETINHQDTRSTKDNSEFRILNSEVPGAPVVKLKVCGSAQKWTARAVLFHGTFLARPDLSLLERWLLPPPRAPEYRGGRSHADFCATLSALLGRELGCAELAAAVAPVWEEKFGLRAVRL